MILLTDNSYELMFGNINEGVMSAAQCMSQCTGCMCNCRCSCSGGFVMDMEWEAL